MIIKSRFPYVWPHLGFSLVVGDNKIEESKIPLAAHAKLLHLSKPGAPTTVVGEDGTRTEVPTLAPISGYEPSKALVAAAEKHFARNSAVKPPVATLETVAKAPPSAQAQPPAAQGQAAPEPERVPDPDNAPEQDRRDPRRRG